MEQIPTLNIEHIPNETLTKIMCFLDLDKLWPSDCNWWINGLNRNASLVNKRWRHLWYHSARDIFIDNTLAGVFGMTSHHFRYALYHPVPHLAWTVAYCDMNEERTELNLWLIHRERGVESSTINAFRCGMFKTTATTEIRDWLSTAFGELMVTQQTCAPRYLALTEMLQEVNRELRELGEAYSPSHHRYITAYNEHTNAKGHLRLLSHSQTEHSTEEEKTTLELQVLIVECLETIHRVADNEATYLSRLFKKPFKIKRRLFKEMRGEHMWNCYDIIPLLRKAFVGV